MTPIGLWTSRRFTLLGYEGVDSEATRLQMGQELGAVHGDQGPRAEWRRNQCIALANLPLPEEITWNVFEGVNFE